MIGGKAQSQITPTAFGALLNASTYGQTIPMIFGRTRASLYAIWTANLRKWASDWSLYFSSWCNLSFFSNDATPPPVTAHLRVPALPRPGQPQLAQRTPDLDDLFPPFMPV